MKVVFECLSKEHPLSVQCYEYEDKYVTYLWSSELAPFWEPTKSETTKQSHPKLSDPNSKYQFSSGPHACLFSLDACLKCHIALWHVMPHKNALPLSALLIEVRCKTLCVRPEGMFNWNPTRPQCGTAGEAEDSKSLNSPSLVLWPGAHDHTSLTSLLWASLASSVN